MTEYRQILTEDLRRVGSPRLGFEDLQRRRTRRDRNRRIRAAIVGLAVTAAGGVFLATTFRDQFSPSPYGTGSLSWTSYSDRYGWTIEVPEDWRTDAISAPGEGAQFVGANMSIQLSVGPPPARWLPGQTPPPGLTIPPTGDSQFPLSSDELLAQVEGGLGGRFFGDGLQFDVFVRSPSLPDDLPQVDADILDRMIGSISFQPWTPGEVRNGWGAIQTPTQDVSWITTRGGLYMLFRTVDGNRLYGSISCAGRPTSNTSVTSDGFAVLECPDGSSWEMNAGGQSQGGGEAGFNDPPPEWPVVTAHDGTLIAYVIPGYFPQGTGGSGYGCRQTGAC